MLNLMDDDPTKEPLEEGEILSPEKLVGQDPSLMAPPSTPGRGGGATRKPRLRVGFGIGGFIARPRARGSLLRRMGMGRGAMGEPIGMAGGPFPGEGG